MRRWVPRWPGRTSMRRRLVGSAGTQRAVRRTGSIRGRWWVIPRHCARDRWSPGGWTRNSAPRRRAPRRGAVRIADRRGAYDLEAAARQRVAGRARGRPVRLAQPPEDSSAGDLRQARRRIREEAVIRACAGGLISPSGTGFMGPRCFEVGVLARHLVRSTLTRSSPSARTRSSTPYR